LKLVDDINLLKPTVMPGVPRVYNKFYDRIKGLMDAATGLKGMIVK